MKEIYKRLSNILAKVSNTEQNKILINNIAALSWLQLIGYLIPLVTLPYLTRVLGVEKYGLMSFAFAFTQYFVLCVDYGFNISATRQISINRDNPLVISKISNSVFIIKLALFIICSIIFIGLTLTIPKFGQDRIIYILAYSAVVGNIIFPIWLFQGFELITKITIINIIVRVAGTIALFVFVKSNSDLGWAIGIQSATVIAAGFISLIIAFHQFKIKVIWPGREYLKNTFKNGGVIFFSTISSVAIVNSNILILGFLTDNISVGYFSIAQKIVWIGVNFVNPVAYAIFPRVSHYFMKSKNNALTFLRKIFIFGLVVFSFISFCFLLLSNYLVKIIIGYPNIISAQLIGMLAMYPLLVFIDNIFGMQIMLNNKMENQFMFTYISTVLISTGLSLLLIPYYGVYGAAVSLITAEIVIILIMIYWLQKGKYKYLSLLLKGNNINI